MKKTTFYISAIVVFIGIVSAIAQPWNLPRENSVGESSLQSVGTQQEEMVSDNVASITESTEKRTGSYQNYDAEVVANTTGTRILFFHASWCVQCRALEKSIQEGQIPADVTIFKVDYDSNQKLRQQYGVTLQTTVVLIDDDGNEVKKYVAYDKPTLQAVIENVL